MRVKLTYFNLDIISFAWLVLWFSGKGWITNCFLFDIRRIGFWALIRLFTLQGAIRKHNKTIAKEVGFSNDDLVKMGLVK